jgi:hypothetical protein
VIHFVAPHDHPAAHHRGLVGQARVDPLPGGEDLRVALFADVDRLDPAGEIDVEDPLRDRVDLVEGRDHRIPEVGALVRQPERRQGGVRPVALGAGVVVVEVVADERDEPAAVLLHEVRQRRRLLRAQRPLDAVEQHQVVVGQQRRRHHARLVQQQRALDRGALVLEPGLELGVRREPEVTEDADVQAVADAVVAGVDVVDIAVTVVVEI